MTDYMIIRSMTLQLLFFLNTNSNKHVVLKIIALVKKNPLKPSGKLRRKSYVQLVKNLLNLMRKTRRKTRSLINEKLPKLNKETRRKTDHLLLYRG